MARTKKQVIVVPSNVKVADLLLQLGQATGHVEESMFLGLTHVTPMGKRILNARASLKDGFTVSFKSNLQVISTIIEKESVEVQELFLSILKETSEAGQAGAELIDDRDKSVTTLSKTTKETRMVFNAFDK
jgi:hypothetical protein